MKVWLKDLRKVYGRKLSITIFSLPINPIYTPNRIQVITKRREITFSRLLINFYSGEIPLALYNLIYFYNIISYSSHKSSLKG